MTVIAESCGLLVVSHYLRTAAFAVVEVGVRLEILLCLHHMGGDAVFCGGAYLFYFFNRKSAFAVFTLQLLCSR